MTLFNDRFRVASTRLKGWDYSSTGYYFVTICTRERQCWLGGVVDGFIRLSPVGEIAEKFWGEIPSHSSGVDLDEFVVMPNHLHGIVIIKDCRRDVACNVSANSNEMSAISPKEGSLGAVIRSYKSAVSNWCRKHSYDFAWQPRFFDEIIRDEKSLEVIREYICNNPLKWELDKDNPANYGRG